MAEVKPESKSSFVFVENHCPIQTVAAGCTKLCATELNLFRKLLGPHVEVQREEHILAGERRCAYRVQEKL
jgi:predicted ArsR family transcriptional regulator